ncbi:MAG: hypothetical protein ABSC42_14315, partial [Tepidisphaeraceae bacterium]
RLPTATGLPQVTVLTGSSATAAANFSNDPIPDNQLFAANKLPETADNSILEPEADSLWNFLESM